jgi:hypothetical protein
MPGFDRTGPRGMGPMTGGARGRCNPYGRRASGRGFFGSWFGQGRGFGRGNRNMFRGAGFSDWSGYGPAGAWGMPDIAPYGQDQDIDILKEQAAFLEKELKAVNRRLQKIESQES